MLQYASLALRRYQVWLILTLLLGACATGPRFDTAGINRALTPNNTVTKLPAIAGKQVLWGGMILSTTNLKDSSDIEVLGFPLDTNQKPRVEQQSLGRFIIHAKGYLEQATYAKNRIITAVGKLSHAQTGKVGESDYTYPVVDAQQLYLWPQESPYDGGNVRFGIGVGIGL